ncbi:MAG: bacteriohopanetetrol glucosamine biosynthesis glycosyltransferase HpnI [Alphaproteobacteria bacterium]|nr:bacteriohopanetetrol glucosamine biosynthesis glycosyltransferase HpnI [Alphaproteobacteria bacterium]
MMAALGWLFLALGLAGGAYTLAAARFAGRVLQRRPDPMPLSFPPVTILKPLYGVEPGLERALASVLNQQYPAPLQVVFGLHAADDPAQAIVAQLKNSFPGRDIAVVVDERRHGSNAKVSNLVNMMAAAKHDVLVLADSDIAVSGPYLKRVVAALDRPGAGAVSCLYAGVGMAGFWSGLAAMGVSYQFLPNAALGIGAGLAHPAMGSTIALTRGTLEAIGGFAAFAGYLADDFEIGRAVRAKGLALAYPPLTVSHFMSERSLGALLGHELRWARTVRTIDPAGHWGSFITHALPLGLIGAILLDFAPVPCAVLAAILVARLSLKARIDHIVGVAAGPAWLLPVRDMLSFGIYVASLFGRRVEWRGSRLTVDRSGTMS